MERRTNQTKPMLVKKKMEFGKYFYLPKKEASAISRLRNTKRKNAKYFGTMPLSLRNNDCWSVDQKSEKKAETKFRNQETAVPGHPKASEYTVQYQIYCLYLLLRTACSAHPTALPSLQHFSTSSSWRHSEKSGKTAALRKPKPCTTGTFAKNKCTRNLSAMRTLQKDHAQRMEI